MLTDRLRRLNRYREIVTILGKYGYGFVIKDIGLSDLLSIKDRVRTGLSDENAQEMGTKIRDLLEELGPTFVKLGQLLSIRSDLLPIEILCQLEKLQDEVTSVPVNEIKEKIKAELGKPVDELFHSFNEECIGAASIGQVHEAVLHSGEKVMVKVQRPGIRKTVYTDLEILKDLSGLMETRYDWAKDYHLTEMIEELSESVKNELDYLEEARNTELVQLQFDGNNSFRVPDIYWDYTTSNILTMERMDGIKLTDLGETNLSKEEKRNVADLLVEAFVTQIIREGFFHGDPHPGNLLYNHSKKQLALIDFGQIGRLSNEMRYDVTSLMIGLMNEDTDTVVKAMYDLTDVPSHVDDKKFYDDIARISKKYSHVPLGEMNFGMTINELFATAQEHRIRIPKDFLMLGKALITVEGIISEIDPSLNLLTLAKPYGEQLVRERYDPIKMGKRLFENTENLTETLFKLPGKIEDVVDKTAEGNLKVEISLSEIGEIFNKIDRISNQVSFSLTLLAFSIVVLGLIVGATFGTNSFMTSIHALEIGFTIAFLMFIWIIYSILKSGRF
ncbi:ABC1 kinase family protein [Neobacillus terrae]|uniref:ABC1 kinase family protein n=1 Tax=Neobacillus terrae TaxID=3034837 RepID=UPI0014087C30|nr:AarF/ABC1/UbiB kinase family protein [Neobacillus terrae]NHM29477.1 AarF/ABC1/UbiB kinase family protein [Neobacillus terrae]